MGSSANQSAWFVYILRDPFTQSIRYVGCTGNLKQRLSGHLNVRPDDRTEKANWIRSLLSRGLAPIMQEVDRGVGGLTAGGEAEIRWIRFFRLLNCPLTNLTSGGERYVFARGQQEPNDANQNSLKRVVVHLPRQRLQQLKAKAAEDSDSVASLVRQAVDELLAVELKE